MKRAICLGVISALNLGNAANAAPAWMLIRSIRLNNDHSMSIRDFPSMEACEAVATHIHSLREIQPHAKKLPGTWTSNSTMYRVEPTIFTVCIPDAKEIEAIAGPLRDAGIYRLLN